MYSLCLKRNITIERCIDKNIFRKNEIVYSSGFQRKSFCLRILSN